MTTVLLFLAVLSFLIAIHEAGHLVSAKLSGVWVHEYSIGFGPRLISKKINETTYSLKPIPFGGYVRMAGEDVGEGAEQDETVPEDRKFYSQNPWTKMLISVSGPAMNIIAAILVIIIAVGLTGTPRISIYGFMEASPSEGKLKPGDQLVAIEGERVDSINQIDAIIPNEEGQNLQVTISRDGNEMKFTITPKYYEDQGKYMLGVQLGTAMTNEVTEVQDNSLLGKAGLKSGDRIVEINGVTVNDGTSIVNAFENLKKEESVSIKATRDGEVINITTEPKDTRDIFTGIFLDTVRNPVGPGVAIKRGITQIKTIIVLTYQGIRMIIRGQIAAGDAVTGPVGIANLLGQSARRGIYSLFFMISLISLNLGLINLVPFPALDGSRIGYATYELIRGKPIPPEKEGLINSIGFLILIGLMVFITYRDILRFFT